jgi:hypothetical protein
MRFVRIWNPTEEVVSTRINGNWFTIKPGAFKSMHENLANFIEMNRKETGLVTLPDEFEPSSDRYVENYHQSDAGKALMAARREDGIRNLIEYYMGIVRNNQVSLRQDLAHRYPTADVSKLAAIEASKGDIEAMRLVNKYKGKAADNAQKQAEEVDKLMKQIGPIVT